MPEDHDKLLEAVLQIARAAGAAILEIYAADFTVETKADHSPLTAADRAAHELILRELGQLTPDIPVWSEESADIPYAERRGWPRLWLVDPLDGTKEFIKRNGEFTVNIALIDGHRPVLGVVHVPAQARSYLAAAGTGAFVDDGDGRRPIRVQRPAAEPVRVVGSRSHRGASLDRYLECLGPHLLVPMGSSLKLCLVASGDADVYPRLGPTSEWDTAAAQAVVESAGGHVVDLDGRALQYNTKPAPLNPYFIVYGDDSRDWLACAR
ncbi:MAG: 3'(2'),5'-bisphosphate nucleotidase [Gammaproteobacteria bacterium]|nr:MAG: 3'(2'),5'-bisphosphate nucleotidase [Gammaproteobacteria bacterium]